MRVPRVAALVTSAAVLAAGMGVLGAFPAAALTSIGALAGAGPRPNATQLDFKAGDSVQAKVDVGSGNLYVTVRGIALPGVSEPVQTGAFYNSAAADQTPVPRLGKGWGLDFSDDIRLTSNADFSATYYGPGGLTGVYTRASSTATTYTSPAGFKSDMVKTSTGWTLTERQSKVKRTFNSSGKLTKVEDRNGNATTITSSSSPYSSFNDLAVVSSASTTDAKTAIVVSDSTHSEIRQEGTDWFRNVSFAKASSTMTKFTDALGRDTSFTYTSAGLLTKIEAPGSVETDFSYDTSKRVSSITQVENNGGSGDAVTRLTYPSTTQTLLAGPNTDQGLAVSAVPHTTYTINTSQRVTNAVDAAGRTRSATYTANFDTATSAVGTGSTSTTTTNTYGANGGDSLTKSASQTGAATSLAYATASPNQYQPSSGTDDAGNASTFTYNGAGNGLTSTDASTAQAKVTRNTDGTVATATSPNNGTNKTTYGYTNKQLTSVTPVTSSSLSASYNSYSIHGLLENVQDGNAVISTRNYDDLDRVTSVDFSDGTSVSYTYDTAGNIDSRTDQYGTTYYTYDQLYRLTFRRYTDVNSVTFGGEMNYVWNPDSTLEATNTDAGGTVLYVYDDSGVLTKIEYPEDTSRPYMRFETDSNGRRTDSWMNVGPTYSDWKARSHTDYDRSGRVSRITADTGTGDTSYTRVVDLSYCYVKNTTAPTCTASTTNDRDKLQWKKDNITGAVTTYTYDTSGRLTSAVVTGSGATTYGYTYNSNGNRLTATAQSQTLTYNAANQISSTGYSYDGAGNMTAQPGNGTMTYTAANQLKTVTKAGTTYTYKHAGLSNDEIISQTTPNGTYKLAYGRENAQGLPVIETIGKDSNVASVINDPVTGQPLMLKTSSGRQAMYVYEGSVGSPIGLLTSSSNQAFAYTYDPFGVPTLTSSTDSDAINQNPYTFAGGLQDRVTGWVHYGARYYDPKTGSFTQQDSLDDPLDPTSANRYSYAGNDPVNLVDPTGNKPKCLRSLIAAGIFEVGVYSLTAGIEAGLLLAAPATAGTSIIVGVTVIGGVTGFLAGEYIPFDKACG